MPGSRTRRFGAVRLDEPAAHRRDGTRIKPNGRDDAIATHQDGDTGALGVGAAVDVGSTSVHLLVAAVGDRLQPIVDESVFLGLGDAVGSDGWLGGDRRTELATALAAYAEVARRNNARPITFLGTEPIRRALDGARIAAEVEGASAVPLHVLDHAEEAMLTLIGVTGGRPVDGELVVVDVGGGSTEIVAVGRGRSAVAAGLRLGSASLTARHVHHDPPLPDEVDRMFDEARRAMATAPDADPAEVVAVGGTASNLVRIASEPGSPGAAGPPGDGRLDRGRIEAALEVLLAEEADSAAARHGVKPIRARLLPAGAVILTAVLERYAAGGVRVSDEGIREGAVLVTVHDPIGWRDRLPELARGWIV